MAEPKRYIVVDHAKQEVTHVDDYRGSQRHPKRPLLLDCDFCNCPSDRLWCRPARPFCIQMSSRRRFIYEGGDWCACVLCNPLVGAREVRTLVTRANIINPNTLAVPRPALEKFYSVVFDATDGPAVEWRAGDVWPRVRES